MAGGLRTRSRRVAFLLLLLSGSFLILLGMLVLGVGLAITHHDDFHDSTAMKEEVEPELDYVQYWIGLPYLFTGISVACSAVNVKRVALTVCTLTLTIACVVLSLAGLVVDGPDWVKWKDRASLQRYWEGQDGYACVTVNETCTCQGTPSRNITSFTDCETLNKLSAIYGVLIGSFIVVLAILLMVIILMVYLLSSKEKRGSIKGRGKVIETRVYQSGYKEPIDARPTTNRRLDDPVPQLSITNRTFKEPVSAIPSANRGFVDDERTRVIQDTFRSKDGESLNYQNREGTMASDGIVMLDPGHFKLGDDDVY